MKLLKMFSSEWTIEIHEMDVSFEIFDYFVRNFRCSKELSKNEYPILDTVYK